MRSSDWDQRYAQAGFVWTPEPNRWVVDELASLSPGRALDLGAGEGRNAIWLAARGWTVTAVDFSQVGLDKGRHHAAAHAPAAAERITWVEADVLTYRPAVAGFELVLLAYLHLVAPDRRHVLRQAAGALAPGGVLLVIGHDLTNLTDGVGGPQDPAVLFTPEMVVADIAPGDLVVERAARVHRPVAVEGGQRLAVDALIRARRGGVSAT